MELVKKCTIYGTRRFIIVFPRTHHWSRSTIMLTLSGKKCILTFTVKYPPLLFEAIHFTHSSTGFEIPLLLRFFKHFSAFVITR
jgi:hypothetical protein